jgi:hypothetical protein
MLQALYPVKFMGQDRTSKGMNTTVEVESALPSEILHQHDVAGILVHLVIENPAAIAGNRDPNPLAHRAALTIGVMLCVAKLKNSTSFVRALMK